MLQNSTIFSILLILPHIILGKHLHEVQKRDVCQDQMREKNECVNRAYETYKKSLAAGDDGRPHWLARKSCNYMTSAIDSCSNLLIGSCHSEGEVNEMKDKQIEGILEQLETTIDAWDSDKCPPVRAHIQRMKGEEKPSCSQVTSDYNKCTKEAFKEHMAAIAKGPDGRPDWIARKTCNYMTAAVEECSKTLIGHCNTEEEVTSMKDYQFQGVLNQLATTVNEWDSEKCPAVKAHVERQGLGIRIATYHEGNDNLHQIADNTIFVMFSYAVASAMYLLT